ncbi:lysosomal alpha-mannosidase-like [Rhipicephalus microplus]|uniref:lysosomal alpha-mannosidase-like n=1 Tax=Rhipicephalus microplus TaxID=6941 RepID=UPI003F6B9AAB
MVTSGQLQFVGGGWVQNDEAVTHYTTIIDQMTLGLRFLNDTFGPQCGVPSVAWQADPFGHSVSQASLFARMGFSSLMIGRISLELKENWTISRSLEFVWQADPPRQGKFIRSLKSTQMAHPPTLVMQVSTSAHLTSCLEHVEHVFFKGSLVWPMLEAAGTIQSRDARAYQEPSVIRNRWIINGGDGGHIFTWVPENTYVNPNEVSFGPEYCSDSGDIYPVQADPMATVLINYANRQANTYNNDTVAMMSGGDLAFVRGDCRFQRQDAFIGEANRISLSTKKRPPVHVVHSTPACYVEALRAKSRTWPHFSGDLLPYTDKPGRTWTGFYTTRPSQKMLVRYANGFLQASKQLSVLGSSDTTTQVRHLAYVAINSPRML